MPALPAEHQLLLERAAEAEKLAAEILELKQQLIDLDRKRQGNVEALATYRERNVNVDMESDKQWLCAGKIFFRVPAKQAKQIILEEQATLSREIEKTRVHIKDRMKAILEYRPSELDSASLRLVLNEATKTETKAEASIL